MDRPPHARRRPRIEEETPKGIANQAVGRFAPFLLLVLLLLLVASSGWALPTPGTAQPPPSGSLVVGFIDVGQDDGVLV